MRYSRLTSAPPKRRGGRYASWIIAAVILGVAAYLITAGAAGGWLAKNIIEPVFGNGNASAATPSPTVSAQSSGTSKPSGTSQASTARVEENITAGEIMLYSLQSGAFSDEANAQAAAQAIATLGGAGYIAYDGQLYRVLVAGYLSETDAKDVQTSLKSDNLSTTVFELKSGTLEFKIGAGQSQVDAVKACFNAVPQAVKTLQQIVYNADRGKNVDGDIKSLASSVTQVYQNLKSAISSDESAIQSLAKYMSGLCEKLNNIHLSNDVSKVEFSSGLKYNLLSIVVDYSAFLEDLSG